MKLNYYIIVLLSLICASHMYAMQGKENTLLGMHILNADFKKFKNAFDTHNATVHDTYDGTPILTATLEAYAAIEDENPQRKKELDVIAHMIQFLLEQGVSLDKTDERGSTALQFAANKSLYRFIPLLLDYGADINAQDKNGNTSLHLAVKSTINGVINPDAPKIVALLLEHGAQTSLVNNKGLTAYQIALTMRDTIKTDSQIVFDMADTTREEALQTINKVIDIFNTHKLKIGLQKIHAREKEKSSTDTHFKFQ